jgi:hypothetical protein
LFIYSHPQVYWNEQVSDLAHYHRGSEYGFSLFLLSTAGVFDRVQVNVAVTQVKLFSQRHGVPYLGCIHRPTGTGFITPAVRTTLHDKIDSAFQNAGFELASYGSVSRKTRQLVEKDIMTPAQLRAGIRAYQHSLTQKFKFPFKSPIIEPSRFDIKVAEGIGTLEAAAIEE